MKKIRLHNLDLWQFESLAKEPAIKHFVTGRHAYSNGNAFTLSYSSSPDKEEIRNNRRVLATALGIQETRLYFPSQIHKTRVVNVTERTTSDALVGTDALMTNQKGICLAVMSADCVPVLLFDKKNNAVAAIHSGWRGTVAKIVEKTLHEMHTTFGTVGGDVVASIGPSVTQESYEVGHDVIQSVDRAFGKESGLMVPRPQNKALLDLLTANLLQLLPFGVPISQIEISALCTVKNNDLFFSARKGDSGRFAAGIMLV